MWALTKVSKGLAIPWHNQQLGSVFTDAEYYSCDKVHFSFHLINGIPGVCWVLLIHQSLGREGGAGETDLIHPSGACTPAQTDRHCVH